MTRSKFYLPAACLLGVAACATYAWTQDETPRVPPTVTRPGPSVDAVREAPPTRGAPGGRGVEREERSGGIRTIDMKNIERGGQGAMRARIVSRTVTENVLEPVSAEELAEIRAFQEAKQALKDAKNEAERKKASEAIQLQLDKLFERDLAQREQDLAAVEERVRTLRQQLNRRTNSKDEIIALRLKTILNNADGLGFPGDEGPEDRASYPPVTVRQPPAGQRGAVFGVPPAAPGDGRGGDPNEVSRRERESNPVAPGEGRGKEPEGRAEPR